ncbi:hypothetical protein Tco_1443334 [Tanacetum coccineum]
MTMAIRALVLTREIFRPSSSLAAASFRTYPVRLISHGPISYTPVRCAAAGSDSNKKASARLSQVQQQLHEAIARSAVGANEPIPNITLVENALLHWSLLRSSLVYITNLNHIHSVLCVQFD